MDETLVTLADLWRPWRWPARVIFGAFAFSQLLMAASAIVRTGVIAPTIISYLFFVTGLALLAVNWGHILPRAVCGVVVSLVVGMAFVEGAFGFIGTERFSDWYLGAAVSVLVALMFWGCWLAGWIAFGLFSIVQFALSAAVGVSWLVTGPILLRHAATLVVSQLIVYTMSRVAQQLTETADRRKRREAEEVIRTTISRARAAQFARIDAIAGPMLRRITEVTPLSATERMECQLVEATLRDQMSGRGWARADIVRAARAARERGVTVVLLDDSHGTNDLAELAANELVPLLDGLTAGSCTARMFTADHPTVASILLDEGASGARVIEIARPAAPVNDGRPVI